MMKTRKEMYEMIIEAMETVEHSEKAEMIEFLNHQLEMVANRNSKSKSASAKRQAENTALAEKVLAVMVEANKPVTATELFKLCSIPEVTSTQKLVALLNILAFNGQVVRKVEKKTSFFSVAKVGE